MTDLDDELAEWRYLCERIDADSWPGRMARQVMT